MYKFKVYIVYTLNLNSQCICKESSHELTTFDWLFSAQNVAHCSRQRELWRKKNEIAQIETNRNSNVQREQRF